jgi:hypothetical protein
MNAEKIICIHLVKQDGEYIVTTRNQITGKRSKTFTNHLTEKEKAFTQEAKHTFEDGLSVYWTV